MRISILGPPGSGKGTVSDKLEKEFHLLHLSAGELLRAQIKKKTKIGRQIKPIVERGDLVPDDITIGLVKAKVKGQKHYLLDGFPRTLYQAQKIQDLHLEKILYLSVSQQQVIERLAGRRVCEQGKHNYHLLYIPPKIVGRCDIDGSRLLQRKDDNPQAILERFRVFRKQTRPVIDYFKKRKVLITIDASATPEAVYAKLQVMLKSKGHNHSR